MVGGVEGFDLLLLGLLSSKLRSKGFEGERVEAPTTDHEYMEGLRGQKKSP